MHFRCVLLLCLGLTGVAAAQELEQLDPVTKTTCIPKRTIQGLWIIDTTHWAFIQDDGAVLLSELTATCPVPVMFGLNGSSLFRRLTQQPDPDLELQAIAGGRATGSTLRLSGTSLGGKNLCALRPLRFGGTPLTCYLGEFVELSATQAQLLFTNPRAIIAPDAVDRSRLLEGEATRQLDLQE